MSYTVKTIYYTIHGEGRHAGSPAVLLRFAGCNLWSGLEEDREGAVCSFCDTDFVGTDGPGGGKFATADELAEAVAVRWPTCENGDGASRRVVVTGGEPLLQTDEPLIEALHERDFAVAVETNGTLPAPAGLDWICVSPKAGSAIVQRSGDELKLVYPQPGVDPEEFAAWDFEHFFLQPMDGPHLADSMAAAVRYSLAHPRWRVSLQMHKALGIP